MGARSGRNRVSVGLGQVLGRTWVGRFIVGLWREGRSVVQWLGLPPVPAHAHVRIHVPVPLPVHAPAPVHACACICIYVHVGPSAQISTSLPMSSRAPTRTGSRYTIVCIYSVSARHGRYRITLINKQRPKTKRHTVLTTLPLGLI
jgi:hypothetical protein